MKSSRKILLLALLQPETVITLLGLGSAIVIAFSGIQQNDLDRTLGALIVILGILSIAQIITNLDRFRMSKTLMSIERSLEHSGMKSHPPLRKRNVLTQMDVRAKDAKSILIIAISGAKHLSNTTYFAERLRDGCKVRVLIASANNDSVLECITKLNGGTIAG